jgi:hypothetical protein
VVHVAEPKRDMRSFKDDGPGITMQEYENGRHQAARNVVLNKDGLAAMVVYNRNNLFAFNRTYRQICNSLTIE